MEYASQLFGISESNTGLSRAKDEHKTIILAHFPSDKQQAALFPYKIATNAFSSSELAVFMLSTASEYLMYACWNRFCRYNALPSSLSFEVAAGMDISYDTKASNGSRP